MIINKIDIISRPYFVAIGVGPHSLEWIKSNGEEETKILRLISKIENFISLYPLQSEMSQVFKFFKAHVDAKNLKREDEKCPRQECHK